MKKTIILFAILTVSLFHINAQDSIKMEPMQLKLDQELVVKNNSEIAVVVRTIPIDLLFELSEDTLNNLLSAPKDTIVLTQNNIFGGEMKRLAISNNYISIQTSKVGNMQIKILPLVNDSKIICVVKTVCGEICDSQVTFYTEKWKPISETDLLPEFQLDWFVKAEVEKDTQDYKNILKAFDIYPIKVKLHPNNFNMSLTLDVESYLSKEDTKKALPLLMDEAKILKWDQVRFK